MYCKAAATDSIRSFWRIVVMVLKVGGEKVREKWWGSLDGLVL